MARRGPGLDHIGEALFLALAAWVLLSGAVVGGNPWPTAGLVLGVGATAFVSRWITRWHAALVPAMVAAGIAGLVLVYGADAVSSEAGPLGYPNANAALYVVGVGAAGMVVLRVAILWIQITFSLIALGLAVLPWFFDALAGGLGAAVVLGTMLVLLTIRGGAATLIRLAAAVAFVSIAITGLLAIAYAGDGEGGGAWIIPERRLVLWSEAADIAVAQPLFGVGPGRFAEENRLSGRDPWAQWAHHEPLEIGAETGLPGLVLMLATVMWTYAWLQRGSGRRGAALTGVLLTVGVVHASIDFVWHFALVPIALAAVVGAGASAGSLRPLPRWLGGGTADIDDVVESWAAEDRQAGGDR